MSYSRILNNAGLNGLVKPQVTQTLRSMKERPMGTGQDPNFVKHTANQVPASNLLNLKSSLLSPAEEKQAFSRR